jgi:hypothetical protein
MAGKLKNRLPPPPPPEDDEPIFTPNEIQLLVRRTMRYGDIYAFHSFVSKLDENSFDIHGSVSRHNNHYVHQKSTSFEMEADLRYATRNGEEITPEEQSNGDDLLNKAQEDIQSLVVNINHAIYSSLENEYNYQTSDEQVEEVINANEYDFDEDGDRGGDLTYDQLEDHAKMKARDWYRQIFGEDSYWSESTLEDWKQFLVDIGFGDEPEIAFSGFSSQGDGASFTCNSFDLTKFVQFLSNPELMQRIDN